MSITISNHSPDAINVYPLKGGLLELELQQKNRIIIFCQIMSEPVTKVESMPIFIQIAEFTNFLLRKK